MGSSSTNTPQVANPAKAYAQGIQTNIEYAPVIASAEQQFRAQYDGASVAQNLQNQQKSGGAFIDLYRQNLAQADPLGQSFENQWGAQVSSDLAKGYKLDGSVTRQVQQATRAEQVTTGNLFGNAAVSKEASAIGQASFAAEQQRLSNAGSFLSHDNAVTFTTAMAGLAQAATQPDRTDSYVNVDSGGTFQNLANQAYQEDVQMAQYVAANPNQFLGPWQRFAQGAYIGLREGWQGGSYGGFVIGAFGAVGGALGGSFQGLINAPDYRFNVANSGYAIYGNSNAGVSAGMFGGSVAASGASAWISAASAAGG